MVETDDAVLQVTVVTIQAPVWLTGLPFSNHFNQLLDVK